MRAPIYNSLVLGASTRLSAVLELVKFVNNDIGYIRHQVRPEYTQDHQTAPYFGLASKHAIWSYFEDQRWKAQAPPRTTHTRILGQFFQNVNGPIHEKIEV